MIKDLELRGRSKDTINNMVCTMKAFSRFYNQPPELFGEKQIIAYLEYCIKCRYYEIVVQEILKVRELI